MTKQSDLGTASALTGSEKILAVQSGTSVNVTPTELSTFAVTITKIADTDYTVLVADHKVGYTAITAPRTLTLPTASSYGEGRLLVIMDLLGAATVTNTLTVVRSSSDTIEGAVNHVAVSTAYGARLYVADGSGNRWVPIT